MNTLKIITSTTRPGNKGTSVANWFTGVAKESSEFEKVELLELAKINLPLMDEPYHPRLQKYQHEHTKRWSETIEEADAIVIVLGEYNYGFPAPIKNALDYLFKEWMYKPVGFVSYGGISAGLRSTQMLKQVVTTLQMVPIGAQVNLPFFEKMIDDKGIFHSDDIVTKSALALLKDLLKWTNTLNPMRQHQQEG